MLTLEQLRAPSKAEAASFDLAEVDLTLTQGLPGSEWIDVPACLAWVDRAASWVRRDTEQILEDFRRDPGEYDHSEATCRVVSMVSLLQKGLGVRYNREQSGDPETWTDARDDFIHGIIAGHGGTCASMPVLYVAVGRRLGYPLHLVTTYRHQFTRWDDPAGERLNIEITSRGLNTFPDDYYRTWPVPLQETPWWWRTRFLHSLSPLEEISQGWRKRGFLLRANGHPREATKGFAIAWSITPEDFQVECCFAGIFGEWKAALARRPHQGPGRPLLESPTRWYPGLSPELEQDLLRVDRLSQA